MKKALLILYLLCIYTLAGCPPSIPNKLRFEFLCEKAKFEEEIYYKQFTIELFKQALYFQEIENPGIVFRQAVLETANFASELFEKAFNCFGMRRAFARPCPAVGDYLFHAQYFHWYDSVRDYKLWQEYRKANGWILDDYFAFLWGVGYAEDSYYIDKLKQIDII